MTIPDIPLPYRFEPTHTTPRGGYLIQAVVRMGRWTFGVDIHGTPNIWPTIDLTPLPPPLPKARVGWYVLNADGDMGECTSLEHAWWEVNDINSASVVVKLCADGVLRHVDRDGNEGAPLEVEQ